MKYQSNRFLFRVFFSTLYTICTANSNSNVFFYRANVCLFSVFVSVSKWKKNRCRFPIAATSASRLISSEQKTHFSHLLFVVIMRTVFVDANASVVVIIVQCNGWNLLKCAHCNRNDIQIYCCCCLMICKWKSGSWLSICMFIGLKSFTVLHIFAMFVYVQLDFFSLLVVN